MKINYKLCSINETVVYKTYESCKRFGAKASYSEIKSIAEDNLVSITGIDISFFDVDIRHNKIELFDTYEYEFEYNKIVMSNFLEKGVLVHTFKKDNELYNLYIILDEETNDEN